MRSYSERSLNSLRGIHPDLRRVIDRALQESPLDFIVIEGLRTRERQEQLVAAGASKTMNSRHLTGHAVDLLPIGLDGKPAFAWPLYDQLAPAVKAAASAEGVPIEWGGDWTSFKDGPHFQLPWAEYPAEAYTPSEAPPKERTSAMQSTTLQAAGGALTVVSGIVTTAITQTTGWAQILLIGGALVISAMLIWIMRERLRHWGEGVR